MKTNNNRDDDSNELESFEKLIGKDIHDAWVDARVRNLSIDVVNALNRRAGHRRQYLRIVLPAALAIVLLIVVLLKPTYNSGSLDTESDSAYDFVPESEVQSALLTAISDDEVVDMIAIEQEPRTIILTDKDIDDLLKDL